MKLDAYSITYEMSEGSMVKDTIRFKDIQEDHQTKLFTMEQQYWINQKSIPDQIMKFI